MTDRDQVAREVLTELANWNMARVETLKDATRFRDERYPAPAAPVTVTVGDWKCSVVPHARDCIVEHIQRAQLPFTSPQGAPLYECVLRIASDARRIEELEAANASLKAEIDRIGAMRQDALGELVRVGHERDEARRALDDLKSRAALGDRDARAALAAQVQAATSQGEGHEVGVSAATCGGSGAAQPVSSNTGELSAAAPSPAPIPLGAQVREYTRIDGGWKERHGISWGDFDDDGVALLVSDLYRATHPVADRATVERVAQAQWGVAPILSNWEYAGSANRATQMNIARAALRALGYTIQEGA